MLATQKLSPAGQLDAQRATMESTRARLDATRARLSDRVITAPFAGVLGFRQVSPGTLVTPGTVIASLDDVSVIKLDFAVPEAFLSAVAPGQAITAGSAAWPDREFNGLVTTVDSRVDPVTRAVTVRAELPNPDRELRPGMLLTVRLFRPERQALVVPEISVIQVARQAHVFRVKDDGTVEQVDVRLGQRRRGEVEVLEGLSAGDRVVVRSNDGRTFGLDAADGTRKWVFDRGVPALSVRGNGAPVSDGQLVYLGYDDGTVVALRLQDGLVGWTQLVAESDGRNELDRMADVDGELALGYQEIYATSFRSQTMAISTANGRPLWNRDVGGYAGLALMADRLIVTDPAGTVWALDRNNGSALWKQEALARRWLTTPALQGDYIVVGDIEGYLHWIRASDGVIAGFGAAGYELAVQAALTQVRERG